MIWEVNQHTLQMQPLCLMLTWLPWDMGDLQDKPLGKRLERGKTSKGLPANLPAWACHDNGSHCSRKETFIAMEPRMMLGMQADSWNHELYEASILVSNQEPCSTCVQLLRARSWRGMLVTLKEERGIDRSLGITIAISSAKNFPLVSKTKQTSFPLPGKAWYKPQCRSPD